MKHRLGLTLVLLCSTRIALATPDVNQVVADAVKHGAHVVSCENHICTDQMTQEQDTVADAKDGSYLTYPDTEEYQPSIQKTQQQLSLNSTQH